MNKRSIFGPVLILLGAYLLLNKGTTFGPGNLFGYFWPSLFIIPLGLFFHWLYFSVTGRKGIGVLIPGGILLVAGITSQIAMLFDNWVYMWPGYIIAVAAGLFEFYWFGNRNKWLLIPINILVVLGLLFFAVFSLGSFLNHVETFRPFLAIALIILGGAALVIRRREH
ncbi:hypothetical protein PALU110988_14915 [Paenibacillus lupini]|uniref:hypothetical protein n=1 Tax=Paenibacillus lupini TaxID=1450204 RepID=UPI001420925A|nr:hypothetical protein [Paenibacillus lupini]NIK25799.1 hypothetical protein [Paenibacillus lupini]